MLASSAKMNFRYFRSHFSVTRNNQDSAGWNTSGKSSSSWIAYCSGPSCCCGNSVVIAKGDARAVTINCFAAISILFPVRYFMICFLSSREMWEGNKDWLLRPKHGETTPPIVLNFETERNLRVNWNHNDLPRNSPLTDFFPKCRQLSTTNPLFVVLSWVGKNTSCGCAGTNTRSDKQLPEFLRTQHH